MRTEEVLPPPPVTIRAAVATTGLAASLLLIGMLVEQLAGAAARVMGWPLLWSLMLAFFAAMTRAGRQWGRMMLVVLVLLTPLLLPVLVFRQSTELDQVPRPEAVVSLALAAVVVQGVGAALAFLPPSTAYVRELRDKVREIPALLRKNVLVVHVLSSVAWLGIITTQAVLGLTAMNTEDRGIALSLFTAMLIIDGTFLGPAAFLALFSGIVLAVGTRWGLLRRYWVAAKFSLMLVLMLLPILFWQDIPHQGYQAMLAGHPLPHIRDTLGGTMLASLVSPATAVAILILSIHKPWGFTPLGQKLNTAHQRSRSLPRRPERPA